MDPKLCGNITQISITPATPLASSPSKMEFPINGFATEMGEGKDDADNVEEEAPNIHQEKTTEEESESEEESEGPEEGDSLLATTPNDTHTPSKTTDEKDRDVNADACHQKKGSPLTTAAVTVATNNGTAAAVAKEARRVMEHPLQEADYPEVSAACPLLQDSESRSQAVVSK